MNPFRKKIVFPNNIRRCWDNLIKRLGFKDFRWHDIRHCCTSYMPQVGMSLGHIENPLVISLLLVQSVMHIFLTKKQSRLESQFLRDCMDNLRTNWMLLSQSNQLQGITRREHLAFNQVVRCSRPRRPTIFLTDIISKKWYYPKLLIPKNHADKALECRQYVDK